MIHALYIKHRFSPLEIYPSRLYFKGHIYRIHVKQKAVFFCVSLPHSQKLLGLITFITWGSGSSRGGQVCWWHQWSLSHNCDTQRRRASASLEFLVNVSGRSLKALQGSKRSRWRTTIHVWQWSEINTWSRWISKVIRWCSNLFSRISLCVCRHISSHQLMRGKQILCSD